METVRSADGTTIAFDRSGRGPALVLVPGALSDRSATAALAAALAPSFTVYGYDRRGRGASGDTAPYSLEREIEDLAAVLAEAGGSAMVFGHSSGAVLALEAASRGLPVSRLAVYEPPYIVEGTRARPAADLAGRVSALVSSGRRGDAVALFLVEAVQMPAQAVAAVRASPRWPGMEALAHTIAYDIAVVDDHGMAVDRMTSIQIPTLALDGGASPAWARAAVRALAAAIPGARRVTLAGQNHAADPEVLAAVLVEHLS